MFFKSLLKKIMLIFCCFAVFSVFSDTEASTNILNNLFLLILTAWDLIQLILEITINTFTALIESNFLSDTILNNLPEGLFGLLASLGKILNDFFDAISKFISSFC